MKDQADIARAGFWLTKAGAALGTGDTAGAAKLLMDAGSLLIQATGAQVEPDEHGDVRVLFHPDGI